MYIIAIFLLAASTLHNVEGRARHALGYERNTRNIAFPEPVSRALHDFAFDLYSKLAPTWRPDQNVVVAPVSIYEVLSILSPGLGGNSFLQVRDVLRLTETQNPHEEVTRMADAIYTTNDTYLLTRANRIYTDQSIHLIKSFESVNADHHKVSVKQLDFGKKPRQSRSKINRYVSRTTHNQISELLPEGAITPTTKLCLVNAIYMEAVWLSPFEESRTSSGVFQVTPSESIEVAIMSTATPIRCFMESSTELDSSVLILPFKGHALSMVILTPNRLGNFAPLEDDNASARIQDILVEIWESRSSRFRKYPLLNPCDVNMPKFTIKHTVGDLKSALKSMGITDIFDSYNSDFSNMIPNPEAKLLYVDDARHQATIKVAEGGVRASAASVLTGSVRISPMIINIDQPFMFLIRHEATGAILFMGKVVRPDFVE